MFFLKNVQSIINNDIKSDLIYLYAVFLVKILKLIDCQK
jgi:hypothetical protein